MKCYASIDRIEGEFAVCEVELLPIEESAKLSFFEKETEMIDVQINRINEAYNDIKEGDIIVVESDNSNISHIYGKDEAEKQRRVKLLEEIMKK